MTTHTSSFTGYKTSYAAVRKARRFALQGMYEWLMTDYRFKQQGNVMFIGDNAPAAIVSRTRATNAMHTVHLGYYHQMMQEIPAKTNELSVLIGATLVDRTISRLSPVEFAVLLIGAYELKYSLHIPYKVVIDEAIELNAHFGSTEGYKLINAVLDKIAKTIRAEEIAQTKSLATQDATLPKLD